MVHCFLVRLAVSVLQLCTVKRTASVPGRIRLLIGSTTTINVINMFGVPWGTECSNIWLGFLIHSNNINLIIQVGLILYLWFRASLIYINTCSRCNTKQSIYYSASSLYMFRVSNTPIIRIT